MINNYSGKVPSCVYSVFSITEWTIMHHQPINEKMDQITNIKSTESLFIVLLWLCFSYILLFHPILNTTVFKLTSIFLCKRPKNKPEQVGD